MDPKWWLSVNEKQKSVQLQAEDCVDLSPIPVVG